jgi:hypothetical protein
VSDHASLGRQVACRVRIERIDAIGLVGAQRAAHAERVADEVFVARGDPWRWLS